MRTRSHAPMRFVMSDTVAMNYPAAGIDNPEVDLMRTLTLIEQVLPDCVLIVCKRSKSPSVQYVSQNSQRILGIGAKTVMKMSLPEFLTLVHPDDIEEVNQCFAFINSLEPYDPLVFRFILHYRVKHGNGSYINITDEKMAISNFCGQYLYMNALKNVTEDVKVHDVKVKVYKSFRNGFKLIRTYFPRLNKTAFTPRQREIVNLMAKGFNNEEIAKQLSVSLATIKNHKTLLFRKLNVKTSIELMSVLSTP